MSKDYWSECIANAFEEAGISATTEQIDSVVSHVENAHENYGQAFYQPESPYPAEIKRLQTELIKERDKIICRECNGYGSITTQGPCHSATSRCYKCHGEGKRTP